MTNIQAMLAVITLAIIAGGTTVAVTAEPAENDMWPHQKMLEVKALMNGA